MHLLRPGVFLVLLKSQRRHLVFGDPVVVVAMWSDEPDETLSGIWRARSARRSARWAEEIMETRRVSRGLTADVLTRNKNSEWTRRLEGTVKLYVLSLCHVQRKPYKRILQQHLETSDLLHLILTLAWTLLTFVCSYIVRHFIQWCRRQHSGLPCPRSCRHNHIHGPDGDAQNWS